MPVRASILVVDDSPEMQRYLRILLECDRYGVETAGTGLEALQLLRNGFTPALVLLDLCMPGLDGLQTLRYLRKLRPNLKVIVCSGEDDPGKIREAESLGAEAYLLKPIQHLYLSAAIERCLQTRPSENSKGKKTVVTRVLTLPRPSPSNRMTIEE
jgi:CheY-like chemotaxis protein